MYGRSLASTSSCSNGRPALLPPAGPLSSSLSAPTTLQPTGIHHGPARPGRRRSDPLPGSLRCAGFNASTTMSYPWLQLRPSFAESCIHAAISHSHSAATDNDNTDLIRSFIYRVVDHMVLNINHTLQFLLCSCGKYFINENSVKRWGCYTLIPPVLL